MRGFAKLVHIPSSSPVSGNVLVGKNEIGETKNDATESVGFCLPDDLFYRNCPTRSDELSFARWVVAPGFDVCLRFNLDAIDKSGSVVNPVDDAINRRHYPDAELQRPDMDEADA